MGEAQQWAVKIIRHGMVDPCTLAEHPHNPKVHTAAQDAVVGASLRELGWLRGVLINERTGRVLDGNERLKLAVAAGQREIPAEWVDVAAADEGKVLLLLDPSGQLYQTQVVRWAQLARQVTTGEAALQAFLAEQAAQHGVGSLAGRSGGAAGVDEVEEPADAQAERLAAVRERWPVQAGEVWALGRHRLWCGDCRDPEGVARVLEGRVPQMVWADPPYGVQVVEPSGYVGRGEVGGYPFGGVPAGTVVRPAASRRAAIGKYAPVLGDDSTATAVAAVRQCLAAWPRAVQVWWGAQYYSDVLPPSSGWLVWDKDTGATKFGDCELAWTNQARAVRLFTHRWNGMLRASEPERRWHPTQKPAALAAWALRDLGQQGDLVFDPFVGAGCSVLAAEQTGRTVVGCELWPAYVSTVCARWQQLTGQEARCDRPLPHGEK